MHNLPADNMWKTVSMIQHSYKTSLKFKLNSWNGFMLIEDSSTHIKVKKVKVKTNKKYLSTISYTYTFLACWPTFEQKFSLRLPHGRVVHLCSVRSTCPRQTTVGLGNIQIRAQQICRLADIISWYWAFAVILVTACGSPICPNIKTVLRLEKMLGLVV